MGPGRTRALDLVVVILGGSNVLGGSDILGGCGGLNSFFSAGRGGGGPGSMDFSGGSGGLNSFFFAGRGGGGLGSTGGGDCAGTCAPAGELDSAVSGIDVDGDWDVESSVTLLL